MAAKPHASAAALVAAAAALPITALPVNAGAQALEDEFVPAVLPPGAAFGIRYLHQRENGGRMRIREPVLWVKSPAGDSWELAATFVVDLISGASPIQVSNATGRPVQVLTGASQYRERRDAGELTVKRRLGEATFAVSHARSDENDYRSSATGLNATLDLDERNTTLAAGIARNRDRVGSRDNPLLDEAKRTDEFLAGITQVLDRDSLVQSNLAFTRQRGYLSDPYRVTFSLYRDGGFPPQVRAPDARPDRREQWAWLTRYKRNTAAKAVLSAEYRFYRDDWGVTAHSVAASWLQPLSPAWKVEAGLRYASQSAADFYAAEITSRPAPRHTSSDQRLAAFGALSPSVKVIWQLTAGSALDLGVTQYRQKAGWKAGGGGSPHFEPLDATVLTAGFVHRF